MNKMTVGYRLISILIKVIQFLISQDKELNVTYRKKFYILASFS